MTNPNLRFSVVACRLCLVVGAALLFVVIFGPRIIHVSAQETESTAERKSSEDLLLRRELSTIGEEIAELRAYLRGLRETQGTIDDEIVAMQAEIARTELSIRQSEVAAKRLALEMAKIEEQIIIYEEDVATYQRTLAELIRSVAESDDSQVIAVLFSGGTLSDIATRIDEAQQVQNQILGGIQVLREASAMLFNEEERLLKRRANEEEARALLLIEKDDLLIKQEIERRLSDSATESMEIARREISVSELDAAKIRRQLYPIGNSGDGLTFEEAYFLVKPLAELVGVRPSFVLAILQKETHFGELKGTGHWRIDMHPRDWEAFLEITAELGLNPDDVPVSRKPSYGWGGAMGPAQFIPSTWLSYRNRVSEVTGNVPPSPWNIEDAFAASAIKLAAGGATAQNEEAEWKAAMLYFAGGNWNNPAYAFYGDTVEDLASRYNAMIQILEEDIAKAESERAGETADSE